MFKLRRTEGNAECMSSRLALHSLTNRYVDVIDPKWAIRIEYLQPWACTAPPNRSVFMYVNRIGPTHNKNRTNKHTHTHLHHQHRRRTVITWSMCRQAKNLTIWWKIKYKSWIRLVYSVAARHVNCRMANGKWKRFLAVDKHIGFHHSALMQWIFCHFVGGVVVVIVPNIETGGEKIARYLQSELYVAAKQHNRHSGAYSITQKITLYSEPNCRLADRAKSDIRQTLFSLA